MAVESNVHFRVSVGFIFHHPFDKKFCILKAKASALPFLKEAIAVGLFLELSVFPCRDPHGQLFSYRCSEPNNLMRFFGAAIDRLSLFYLNTTNLSSARWFM
jgi:hypothetical protein